MPFALFFLLIPGQYAQSLYAEGGRLTTAAFIGTANGSEAVTLAISLRPVGLSVIVSLAPSSHRPVGYVTRPTHSQTRCRAHAEQSALGGALSMGSSAISAFLGRGRRRPA